MEQAWNAFFEAVRQVLIMVVQPLVMLAHQVGITINPAQAWMLLFTSLFVGYGIVFLYSEFVLWRRGQPAVGTVVGLDPGDETPDRPKIEFRDTWGNPVVFTSHLGVNDTTKAIGAKVPIVFDPRHPRRARELGRLGAKAYHLAFLAVMIAFMILATFLAESAIY